MCSSFPQRTEGIIAMKRYSCSFNCTHQSYLDNNHDIIVVNENSNPGYKYRRNIFSSRVLLEQFSCKCTTILCIIFKQYICRISVSAFYSCSKQGNDLPLNSATPLEEIIDKVFRAILVSFRDARRWQHFPVVTSLKVSRAVFGCWECHTGLSVLYLSYKAYTSLLMKDFVLTTLLVFQYFTNSVN